MSSFFITGTDTDAGKTIAAAAITVQLKASGKKVVPVKPVQTGCLIKNGEVTVPDLDFTFRVSGIKREMEDENYICSYRYIPACSPHLAATMAKDKIEISEILKSIKFLKKKYDSVIVEGAGGILVPLNNSQMMVDLMCDLSFPVILAARPGLGTINHTLLSINALRSEGLNVVGVIFCATHPLKGDFIEKDNIQTIKKLGNVEILGTIPFVENIEKITSEEFLALSKRAISLPKESL